MTELKERIFMHWKNKKIDILVEKDSDDNQNLFLKNAKY
jgi:hypothetical protein